MNLVQFREAEKIKKKKNRILSFKWTAPWDLI